jgi:hypothetical protein
MKIFNVLIRMKEFLEEGLEQYLLCGDDGIVEELLQEIDSVPVMQAIGWTAVDSLDKRMFTLTPPSEQMIRICKLEKIQEVYMEVSDEP